MTDKPTTSKLMQSVSTRMVSSQNMLLAGVGVLVAGLFVNVALSPAKGGPERPRAVIEARAVQSVSDRNAILTRFGLTDADMEVNTQHAQSDVKNVKSKSNAKSTEALAEMFDQMNYDLDHVRQGGGDVPRVILASLPQDLHRVREVSLRKTMFFQTVLPLVLQVNEEIMAERRRLWDIHSRQRLGVALPAEDRLWLAMMADRYKTPRGDVGKLLKKVDIVPPSLALAQAATESGWGTSRFVREGNAMFGEWTWTPGAGIVPLDRDAGKTHTIRAFDSLVDSVRSYARNINTHRAYKALRAERAVMRAKSVPLDGGQLARHLLHYSERGAEYVSDITQLIDSNDLSRLDDARLVGDRVLDDAA